MKLTFLGTGTSLGSPVIGCDCAASQSADPRDQRLRTSALIEVGGVTIVIDAGPDFRQQMLRVGVRHVDGILLTHEHKDHVAGLDDVRALNHAMRGAVHIYATERVQQRVRQDFDYAFAELRYPGAPLIELHTIDSQSFTVAKQNFALHGGEAVSAVSVTPIHGMHARMPITGFRIGSLAYLTDFGAIEEEQIILLRGLDVLVINALRHEPHLSHFSLDEALCVAERTGARHVYLTHVSHEMGFYDQISHEVPDNVHFAYDGLTIETSQ